MILVDTSVWVDHLCTGDPQLAALLERSAAAMQPTVLVNAGTRLWTRNRRLRETAEHLRLAFAEPDT